MKSDSETVEMAKNIQALKALQSYNEEEETKRVQAESPAVGSVLPAVASVKANEAKQIQEIEIDERQNETGRMEEDTKV